MSYHKDNPTEQQIDAHINAAGRHYKAGNHEKCDNHLKAVLQLRRTHKILDFGRDSLEQWIARDAKHAERTRVEALKNRGKTEPMESGTAPNEGRGTQAVFPQNSEGSEAAK